MTEYNSYMESRDKFDNYNYDCDHEAQKINEYYNSGNEVSEFHWQPVAKDIEFKKQIIKLKRMKRFNERR